MPIVAALLSCRVDQAQVERALMPPTAIRVCSTVNELRRITSRGQVLAVVAEMFDRTGTSVVSLTRELCWKFPSLPVILYPRLTPREIHDAVPLVHYRSVSMVLRGYDDLHVGLASRLTPGGNSRVTEALKTLLLPRVPSALASTLAFCVTQCRRPLAVGDVARVARLDRGTLRRHFLRVGLPPPSRMIGWCRLAHAGDLLGDPGRTLESVALELSFASAAALHHMLRRYTRLTASEVRARGGLAGVLGALEQHLVCNSQQVPAEADSN